MSNNIVSTMNAGGPHNNRGPSGSRLSTYPTRGSGGARLGGDRQGVRP